MEASKSKLNEFQSIIVKGKSLGLNMTDISEKFENAILNSKDDIIRIVLLGAFSDGKTSAIAGLLGQVIDNMKIDIDESSDELEIYRPKGLKQGYEIVDTPGLFGTKSKEIDGKEIKYSDITAVPLKWASRSLKQLKHSLLEEVFHVRRFESVILQPINGLLYEQKQICVRTIG